MANETLIGTEFFLAAPGKGGFFLTSFPFILRFVCRASRTLATSWSLRSASGNGSGIRRMIHLSVRDTHLNQPLRTGSWQPQSFVTTLVRSRTLEPTQSNISQTSHKCLMTPSSSLLHTGLAFSCFEFICNFCRCLGFLTCIFHAVPEIHISTRTHTT